MLTCTGLLYEKLIGEGGLRGHGALPPVLPIVIYNGGRPWSAAVEVADLIESEAFPSAHRSLPPSPPGPPCAAGYRPQR